MSIPDSDLLLFSAVLFEAVTTDAGMVALFEPAPVRLSYGMGVPDSEMPYIVWKVTDGDSSHGAMKPFDLLFSVYDYGPNAERAAAIAERFETVAGARGWLPRADGSACCRTYWPRNRFPVETKNEEVHRIDGSIPGRRWHQKMALEVLARDPLSPP